MRADVAIKNLNAFLKPFFVFVLILLQSVSTFAIFQSPINIPYLYALEKDGNVSFVFGTIHLPTSPAVFPQYLIDALNSRPIFLGETSIKDASTPTLQKQKNNVPEHIKKRLEERGISRHEIEYSEVRRLCALYQLWDIKGKNTFYAMDARLQDFAKSNGSQFYALDTDLTLLQEAKKEIFSCTLKELSDLVEKTPPKEMEAIMKVRFLISYQLYLNGNEGLMSSKKGAVTTAKRNHVWMTHLLKFHQQGFFAAGGVSHLDPKNPDGLLPLLEKEGFKITHVTNEKILSDLFQKYNIH